METSAGLLNFCAGNSPVTGEFPSQRPVTQSFDIFFDLHLNKRSVNNRDAGDLRCHPAHYEVTFMFLLQADANVILVDWEDWAGESYYPNSASNTRITGKNIGVILEGLLAHGFHLSSIWCIGTSLGAHTCGFAGKRQNLN